MARCPSCGASSLFGLNIRQCVLCGKTVCNHCVPELIAPIPVKVAHEQESNSNYQIISFCSLSCSNQFWQRVGDYQLDYDIGTDIENFEKNLITSWNKAICNTFAPSSIARAMGNKAIQMHTRKSPAFPWWDSSGKHLLSFKQFKAKAKTALAQNLEKCGRTSDAAKIFEELRVYDKARELRERDRHILIKKLMFQ
jgi:hypothetical protein